MIDRLTATGSLALRHLGAYGDLVASDLSHSSRLVRAQVVAAAVLTLGIAFALALGCVWAIAAAWDTPARLWVIAALLLCAAVLAAAGLWRLRVLDAQGPVFLAQTAREWRKDRELLEELLARRTAEES